ncbi:MAG: ribosome hibernation-promoting factor, HPF/YfiA family [Pyrinomonadaceae bacterium]
MNYEYTGRHIEVTPALRTHVENHFGKIKHLFDGNVTKAHVIIEVEKGRHRAEIILNMRDRVLTADSTVSDMYQALTQTIDKLEKQALKLKNKVKDKHQKAQKVGTIPSVIDEEIKPAANLPRIINVKRNSIKPMTAEEAILKIGEDGNQFVMFRDSENEKISVLYKRKDGNYGLIQP